ncbi:FAD-dependent monooxygenase [Kribbella sp. NBC_01505]|uniref:FAD-dependent oxidoreductase n=1 Tax=Kribbella sp. NBC_01505 TaxID=2903580 RepID=UPI00386DB8E9
MNVDVVVVGAGPVGLAAGAALRQHGHTVLVVDKLAEGANTSRAAVVHARTLEVLEQLGVTERLVAAGHSVQDFAVREGDRVLVPVSLRRLLTAYTFALMIPQSTTERILLERLVELGGEVRRPCAAMGLTQTGESAAVTLDTGEVITARYVVAADGMRSTIRELSGLTMPGNVLPLSASLVDVRVDGGLPTDEVGLYLAKAGLLLVAPLPDGIFRLVAEVPDAPEHPDLAAAQRMLTERGPESNPPTVTEVIWGSRFRIHERVADSYQAGRVLLAGDAAHTHSPAGGQGMNLGLRDAVAVANALHTALTTSDETELDQYGATARAEAVRVIALSHRLTTMASAPQFVRPLRNVVLRLVGGSESVTDGFGRQLAGLAEG